MPEKPSISKSRIKTLQRCGMQYYYRHVENIVAPPAVSMLEGTVVHSVIHENLTHKKERGTLLPEEYVADLAADSLKANWLAEEPMLDEDERKLGPKIVRAEAIDRSVKLSRIHYQRVAPVVRPKHLERKFVLNIPGYPYNVTGIIDIQEENGTLRDWKTTRKTPSQDLADRSIDLDVYYLAATVLDKLPPGKVALDFLVGQKKSYHECFTSTRGPEDNLRTLKLIERSIRTIDAGAFMPTTPDSWVCSEKWCGYFDRCPFGRRREVKFGQAGIGAKNGEKTEVQS